MNNKRPSVARVDANYAGLQIFFQGSYASISSFTVIYLSYRGLTNTQIGFTSSIACVISILAQLLISNYCDKHFGLPIKRVISAVFMFGIFIAGILNYVTLPAAMMILMYSMISAVQSSNYGFVNAQLMQFNNVGIPAHYGWPRGLGSLSWGAAAYILAKLVDKYSPALLMPFYMIGTAITILMVLLMPNPYKNLSPEMISSFRKPSNQTSYKEMLAGNRMLIFLLAAIIINGMGSTATYTFTINIVKELGYSTTEYGVSEFIRAAIELPMLFASPLLLKKIKPKYLVMTAFFFNGLRAIFISTAPSMTVIYLCSAMNMFYIGIYAFASTIFVNSIVRQHEQVRGQSLIALCGSIGNIVGSLFSGIIVDALGTRTAIFISSCFCFTALLTMFFFCREKKQVGKIISHA